MKYCFGICGAKQRFISCTVSNKPSSGLWLEVLVDGHRILDVVGFHSVFVCCGCNVHHGG